MVRGKASPDKTYVSDKILGRLFRALQGKIASAVNGIGSTGSEFVQDHRVTDIVEKFRHNPRYPELVDRMERAVRQYMSDRVDHLREKENRTSGILRGVNEENVEEIVDWKSLYFQKKRDDIIDKDGFTSVRPELVAAVLYQVGMEEEKQWREARKGTPSGVSYPDSGGPMEFVWGVVDLELRKEVFCKGRNAMVVDDRMEATYMMGISKRKA